ncbi:Phosphodiesterase/alkaline phosphatase D [Methylacidimicrobium sp. AP8]|uniref:alkaline phosphatase D family protein n=1 Tax=Methylacidimicrobium sp. AP8 TaxID=2730359 RepID=UPI0018C14891|nr:alkaline phosphatase D family protein [Methylacidimicrobium sp. AP8]CAB4243969.1 Phosphodiesterase/alkaline phosphatase D [Methylacidimicrobium sp. AP8]
MVFRPAPASGAPLLAALLLALLPAASGRAADPFFPYGVASGDPETHSVILWTRIESGKPSVSLRYEVATDPDFRRVVASGEVETGPARDYTAKADVTGLEPGTRYFYRWSGEGHRSPTGRTETLPERADRFRIAVASCQHYGAGFYTAYRSIAADQPDLLVHLGDWIYEFPTYGAAAARPDPVGVAEDLSSYRAKHRLYRSDPDFQRALQSVPVAAIWDDHEVQNDYSGKAARFYAPRRLQAAYQAYFEYVPIRPQEEFRIYRSFRIGDLAELFLTDGRQYRDEDVWHPAFFPPPDAARQALAPGRSMLGAAQRDWLLTGLSRSPALWKLIGSGDLMMDLRLHGLPVSVDSWDGFAWEKEQILAAIAAKQIRNVLVLSGDTHVFSYGELRYQGKPVALEVGTAGISSPAGKLERAAEVEAANPHILFSDRDHRGYVLLDIGREAIEVSFYGFSTVLEPDGRRILLRRFRIPRS